MTGENIDVMAISGRESLIYSYNDVVPIAFLRVFGAIAHGMCLFVPFIGGLKWKDLSLAARMPWWLLIGFISSSGLMILDEIFRLWKAFAKGMNVYAWSLGIAREVDKLLQEPKNGQVMHRHNDRPNGNARKHRYNVGYFEIYQIEQMGSPIREIGEFSFHEDQLREVAI